MGRDSYPVHFSPEALKFAKLLNIVLIKIPESTTDLFQALDCRIFGVLKYFIYFQHKTEDSYALDQNEFQKLIDSNRFIFLSKV